MLDVTAAQRHHIEWTTVFVTERHARHFVVLRQRRHSSTHARSDRRR